MLLHTGNIPPQIRRHLSFDPLIRKIRLRAKLFSETRIQAKCSYSIADAMMSAIAMFALKDASLLAFQHRRNDENMKSLFRIQNVPSDTQMREILDPLEPDLLRPPVKRYRSTTSFDNCNVERRWSRTRFIKAVICWPWMARDTSRQTRSIANSVCKERTATQARSLTIIKCWELRSFIPITSKSFRWHPNRS
jgi:hypothetical protein